MPVEITADIESGKTVLIDTITNDLYHQDYKRTVELAKLYKQLITGDKINELLRKFSRREDDALFKQREELTQAITPSVSSSITSPFYKVGRVNAIVKKIDFKSARDNEKNLDDINVALEKYNGDRSLDKYMETRYVDMSFNDPNSFIITEFDKVERGPLGEMMDKVLPRPWEVSAEEAVNYFYYNNILQWLIVRQGIIYKSTKSIEGKNEKEAKDEKGYCFTMYLKNDAIRFTQVDPETPGVNANDGTFSIGLAVDPDGRQITIEYYRVDKNRLFMVEYFNHKAGVVPAIRIGYKRDLTTNGRTCVNPMHDAVPYFLKTIKTVSEFDLTMALHAFPQKFQYVGKCYGESTTITCEGGKTPDGGSCRTCKGTGLAPIHTSAQDAVVIRMPKKPEEMLDLEKMVHYEYPPIDLLKFQNDYIRELKSDAQKSVFNSEIFSRNEVTATATEKTIQLDSVYDTLFPFAEQYSNVWMYIVKVVSKFRDIDDAIPHHQFPKDLKFKSVEQLLSELKVANESNAPGYVKQELSKDIAEQQFIDKPEELKRIIAKQKHFPFGDKTPAEIMNIISSNLTTKFKEVLWANFDDIFSELEMEAEDKNEYFYDYAPKKQKELINKKVDELMGIMKEEEPAEPLRFGEPSTEEETDTQSE